MVELIQKGKHFCNFCKQWKKHGNAIYKYLDNGKSDFDTFICKDCNTMFNQKAIASLEMQNPKQNQRSKV